MDAQEDFSSLSIADRLQHKVWKARVSGCEDLTKLLHSTMEDSDFYTYEPFLKKLVTDANAVAQEAGLAAVVEYVSNAPNASSTRETVIPSLVDKCLGATKQGTKQRATDIILLYAEIDTPDPIVELVIPGTTAKQPKLVTQTVIVLKELVKQFGTKKVGPKPIIKILPKLFGHTDKNVRAETSALTIELYRWIGQAIMNSLADLKPVQIKELEEQFSKLPSEKAKPERLIRAEQVVEEEEEEQPVDQGDGEQNDQDEAEDVEMDAYDLADPVDITAKLPNNFYELLASKKWQERREALDALLEQAKTPKILDKDYSELMTALSKRINDANILLVGTTATCVETIANGLRQDFAKYKPVLTPVIIEKLKERKPAILEQLSNAMNAVFASVPLSEITEDIVAGSKHKNPQVRANCIKLVSRRLKEIKQMPEKNDIKQLSEIMKKMLDDADAGAREAAAEGLGTMMKLIGEKPMLAFTDGLDDIKMGKIKEFCEAAVVKAKPAKKAAPPPPVKKAVAPAKKPVAAAVKPKPKKAAPAPEPMDIDDEAPAMAPPKRKPPARLAGSAKKPALSSSKPKPKPAAAPAGGKKSAKLPPSSGPEEIRYKFTQEDADARATEFIPENIYTELGQAQWKARLAAIESFCQHVEREEVAEPEIVIRALSKKPGWKEMNFQVMGKLFLVIQLMATHSPKFNKACAALTIPVMVEKLGDIKLKKPASECLVEIAEKTSLPFVFSQTYPVLKKLKSPKVLADSLIWIHSSLMDFGIAGLQVRDLIDLLKFALANTNASVRTSAVTVLGALRQFIGPEVKSFVEDVSPALLANIEAEFERVSKLDPPQPSRAPNNGDSDDDGGDGGDASADAIESLFPRVDISGQLGKTIAECNDASWKIRKEGLEKVMSIISGANNRIKPSLGPDFPGVLKQRLNDSNKNLQTVAVEIAGLLAVAMGQPFEKYLKPFTGPVIAVLSDNKANVRAASITTLDHFRETCTMEGMVSSFGTSLSADSPSLRKELLTWLGKSIKEEPNANKYDFTGVISPLFNCLQDRNADVRKAAQACLPQIISAAGYDTVMSKTSELKAAQRQTVLPLLEAARGSAPASTPTPKKTESAATPPPPAAASPASGSGSPSRLRTPAKKKLGLPTPRSAQAASSPSSAGAAAEEVVAPVLTSDSRAKLVRSKKENRWQFDTPRSDVIESLKALFDVNMSPEVTGLLFSNSQYAEKDRLNGLALLNDAIASPDISESKYGIDFSDMKQRYVANADLILKYLTIRFFDTNTSMLIKCLDITQNLISVLDDSGYHLSEYEAVSFLPFLINKVGDPKETMRTRIRNILKAICRIYPASKVFNYLLDAAANSKNAKTRAECLEEIGSLIQRNGISVMLPNKALPLIAVHIGDRDAGVRNAALNGVAQTYILIGDAVMKHMTRLGEKEKGMLEERLKRTKPSASVLAAAEKERAKQQEAEEMEVDELPSLTNLPRRSQIGKPRQRPQPAPVAPPEPEPMEDVMDDYGQRIREPHGGNIRTEMRQPRSMQYQPQPPPQQQQQQVGQQEDMIAYLISQITDGDPQSSIDALKQLDHLLSQYPESILPDIENLVNAITLQVRIAYPAVDPRQPATTRLCKHLVNALVLLFSNRDLACAVPLESLRHLLQELTHRLLDQKMLQLESGPQLSKALNVAMVKVLENSKRNITFSALLSILGSCSEGLRPGDSPSAKNTKYTELIMKCLWKLAKTIQENLRTHILDPDELLFEINQFFIVTPPAEWKRRVSENVPLGEMPLRTVKTLLLELVIGLDDSIFQHLTLIESPERSSVYPYLHHMLEACRKKEHMQHQQQQGFKQPIQQQQTHRQSMQAEMGHSRNSSLSRPSSISSLKSNTIIRSPSMASYSSGENPEQHVDQPAYSPRMQSQTIQPQPMQQQPMQQQPMQQPIDDTDKAAMTDSEFNRALTQIFNKIGDRGKTKEGIIELYEFQKKYPYLEGKVNNCLNQTGGHFRNYIKRALSNLAADDNEMQANAATQAAVQAAANAFDANQESMNEQPSPPPQQRYSMDLSRLSSTAGDRTSSIHTGDEAAEIKMRFHRLQQKFGYNKSEMENNGGLSTADPSSPTKKEGSSPSSYSSFSRRQSSISHENNADKQQPTSVSALKERLEKMKQAINSAASSTT
ncbi:ARM repeat-containing protein [Backusella circina FSU 941]|nr:ARM repeat-containing protein [Backusella circina FSU 941]